jgi:DNA polymerase I-like protein with 3'-5' exonuclease and polymerase domains
MEQDIHTICLDQEKFGFPFNERKAQLLLAKLLARKAELYASIYLQLGPSWVVGVEDRVSSRTVKYKDVERGNEFAGSEWTKIKVVAFNPNSRAHLAKRLIEVFKWKPTEFGEDGLPSLDDEVLNTMKLPIAPLIAEFLMLQKRLGQLAEGEQAWMTMVGEDGRIHGRVNTMGAITARASHSKPNLAQIPSNHSPYGKECRELFECPKGWKLFGTDASGLELRMLAHYMAMYDGGAYGELILKGDVHKANQLAAGLPTRDNAKTFIYGFLYGAGDAKLAEIINGTKAQGKALKEKFLRNTPALASLREAVAAKVESAGCLKALDGRIIPVRHKHAAVNTLLQSAGAIVCKQWTIYIHELLRADGYILNVDFAQLAWVHDELQIGYNPERLTNEYLVSISKKSMAMVTKLFKLRIPLDAEGNSGDSYAETH